MTLTTGDMAAITAMMGTMTTTLGIIVRYFVKSEIRVAVDRLRLELATERTRALEARIHGTES